MGTWSSYMIILNRVIVIVALDTCFFRIAGEANEDTQKGRVWSNCLARFYRLQLGCLDSRREKVT
jgi:hypothetical protein